MAPKNSQIIKFNDHRMFLANEMKIKRYDKILINQLIYIFMYNDLNQIFIIVIAKSINKVYFINIRIKHLDTDSRLDKHSDIDNFFSPQNFNPISVISNSIEKEFLYTDFRSNIFYQFTYENEIVKIFVLGIRENKKLYIFEYHKSNSCIQKYVRENNHIKVRYVKLILDKQENVIRQICYVKNIKQEFRYSLEM